MTQVNRLHIFNQEFDDTYHATKGQTTTRAGYLIFSRDETE